MKIDYTLDEKDFLIFQLFLASGSDRIKKKRQKNRILVSVIFLFFAVVFFTDEKYLLAISFSVVAIVWFLVHPLYESRRYVQHYKGFIKENYQERIGRKVSVEFTDDIIFANDQGSESKIFTSELAAIVEIPTNIFVTMKSGQSLILSKNNIADLELLIAKLKELAIHLDIKYANHTQWKWK